MCGCGGDCGTLIRDRETRTEKDHDVLNQVLESHLHPSKGLSFPGRLGYSAQRQGRSWSRGGRNKEAALVEQAFFQ